MSDNKSQKSDCKNLSEEIESCTCKERVFAEMMAKLDSESINHLHVTAVHRTK